jgi:hypothetical protein
MSSIKQFWKNVKDNEPLDFSVFQESPLNSLSPNKDGELLWEILLRTNNINELMYYINWLKKFRRPTLIEAFLRNKGRRGTTPFLTAVGINNIDAMNELLSLASKFNLTQLLLTDTDSDGRTPIHLASLLASLSENPVKRIETLKFLYLWMKTNNLKISKNILRNWNAYFTDDIKKVLAENSNIQTELLKKNSGSGKAARLAEEAARRAQEEAEAARVAAEAEAARRAQEEEAARRAQQEAEAARRAQQEAEAARRAQEAEATRRVQEEATRKAQEEAARQAAESTKRAQEEATRKAQEEAARKAQEEATRLAQEEAARIAQEARQAREAISKAQANAAARKAARTAARIAARDKLRKEKTNVVAAKEKVQKNKKDAIEKAKKDFNDAFNLYTRNQIIPLQTLRKLIIPFKPTAIDALVEPYEKEFYIFKNEKEDEINYFFNKSQYPFSCILSLEEKYIEIQNLQYTLWKAAYELPLFGVNNKIIIYYNKKKVLVYRDILIAISNKFIQECAQFDGGGGNLPLFRKRLQKDQAAKAIEEADIRVHEANMLEGQARGNRKYNNIINHIESLIVLMDQEKQKVDLPRQLATEEEIQQLLTQNIREELESLTKERENVESFQKSVVEILQLETRLIELIRAEIERRKLVPVSAEVGITITPEVLKREAEKYFAQVKSTTLAEEPTVAEEQENKEDRKEKPFAEYKNEFIKLIEERNQDALIQLINKFVQSGFDINTKIDENEFTLLLLAIKAKLKNVVKRILELGADPNKGESIGLTPLMLAIIVIEPVNIREYGTLAVVQLLLSHKDINTNLENNLNLDAYTYAIKKVDFIRDSSQKELFKKEVIDKLYAKRPYRVVKALSKFLGRGGTRRMKKHAGRHSIKRDRSK